MKLLVVSHACATPVNQQLYAELRRQTGWDVTLVVPSNWLDEYGRTLPTERWPAFDGRLVGMPVRRAGNIILHTYRASFTQLIRNEDPDVIYVNHEPYAAATAQVLWGKWRAGGRSRAFGFYSCQNIAKTYPPPFRWTESLVLKSSVFAFPISSAVDTVFRGKGYRAASTVLPLAIDTGVYYPRPDADVARRDLLGVDAPADAVLLGYVGRFVPEKGLLTLLDAFSQLGRPCARLALIGAGPMEADLRQRTVTLGIEKTVHFAGFVPHVEVPRLLSAIDALVLPSETQSNWREQFGRVLLEAMACGTAVVGSDSGEIPLLIRDTGGGLTFREGDAADCAAALGRIVDDAPLRQSLAAAGRNAVADRYTVETTAARFADAVRAAIAARQTLTVASIAGAVSS